MPVRDSQTLDVTLMDREFRVACKPAEREALLAAVQIVDAQMREIAGQTNAAGERLAVMAALNIAHELLLVRQSGAVDLPEIRRRIDRMQARIDDALGGQEKLF